MINWISPHQFREEVIKMKSLERALLREMYVKPFHSLKEVDRIQKKLAKSYNRINELHQELHRKEVA